MSGDANALAGPSSGQAPDATSPVPPATPPAGDDAPPQPTAAEGRPVAYPPDPVGTRPKVTAASLRPPPEASPTITAAADGGAHPLGQTFRVAEATAAAGLVAGPTPSALARGGGPGPIDADLPVESPHAPRFQFILGALLALGLAAVAIAAYLVGGGRDPVPGDWSAWHPTASGIQAAGQIANHVAAEYRQPDLGQLLAVKGGPLALAGVPVTIALKTGAAATAGVSVLSGNAVLFKMCGLGPACTIAGKASVERLMLVRREALELALYTFQYSGADQVVVFLPPVLHPTPVPGQPKKVKVSSDPTDAVFFRAADLAGELSHPLAATLTTPPPTLTTIDRAPDTALVNGLTSPSFYKFSFVQTSQDASLFLVLEPFAVGN